MIIFDIAATEVYYSGIALAEDGDIEDGEADHRTALMASASKPILTHDAYIATCSCKKIQIGLAMV